MSPSIRILGASFANLDSSDLPIILHLPCDFAVILVQTLVESGDLGLLEIYNQDFTFRKSGGVRRGNVIFSLFLVFVHVDIHVASCLPYICPLI